MEPAVDLKHLAGGNRDHALKRSNADKRRCVEIALREFGGMSDRAIAEMCGVSDRFVGNIRPEPTANGSQLRTGQDGKTRKMPVKPSKPEPAKIQLLPEPEQEPEVEAAVEDVVRPDHTIPPARISAPSFGLQYATAAIMQLEKIHRNDTQRVEAGQEVIRWIERNLFVKGGK